MLEASRLRTALELVLLGGSLREQAAHRGELLRRGEVRRGGDRDLLRRQIVPRPHERQRLERLRGRTQERDAVRIAGLLDDRAILDDDRVHGVRRFDDGASPNDHLDRVHCASLWKRRV